MRDLVNRHNNHVSSVTIRERLSLAPNHCFVGIFDIFLRRNFLLLLPSVSTCLCWQDFRRSCGSRNYSAWFSARVCQLRRYVKKTTVLPLQLPPPTPRLPWREWSWHGGVVVFAALDFSQPGRLITPNNKVLSEKEGPPIESLPKT